MSVSKIQAAISYPSPDCLPDGSGSLIRIEQKTCAVSEPVTHYRMHTYRPGKLREEIPKEGGFGPPRAVTPWEKKKNITSPIIPYTSGIKFLGVYLVRFNPCERAQRIN
jgi:hypothetical protein